MVGSRPRYASTWASLSSRPKVARAILFSSSMVVVIIASLDAPCRRGPTGA
jgi:hypothetical protein